MRVAFLYGPFCLGGDGKNGFRASNLWDDDRGLTGSELSFFRIAQELALRGHDVVAYSFFQDGPLPGVLGSIRLRPITSLITEINGWDAVCSWNEPDLLRIIPERTVRLCNLQINSFTHCKPGFQNHVDVFTSPSSSHRQMVLGKHHPVGSDHSISHETYIANPSKWKVLPNGCDPDKYPTPGSSVVPGRVIYASSPDRGLHWLLQEWPKIKSAVPHATLRIFYKLMSWVTLVSPYEPPSHDRAAIEQVARARYIGEAIRRYSTRPDIGVEIHGSVSRSRMNMEMSEAEVLAYPCDTMSWTEGFSVTLMEACASQTVPVTCGVDALPEIYGSSVPMVPPPMRTSFEAFSGLVIRSLTDDKFRQDTLDRCRQLALDYTWPVIASKLEMIIKDAKASKGL